MGWTRESKAKEYATNAVKEVAIQYLETIMSLQSNTDTRILE